MKFFQQDNYFTYREVSETLNLRMIAVISPARSYDLTTCDFFMENSAIEGLYQNTEFNYRQNNQILQSSTSFVKHSTDLAALPFLIAQRLF